MKKTYVAEDGTETVIEGTPEEIAAYERERSRSSGEKQPAPVKEDQGGRRVLTDEIVRALTEAVQKIQPRCSCPYHFHLCPLWYVQQTVVQPQWEPYLGGGIVCGTTTATELKLELLDTGESPAGTWDWTKVELNSSTSEITLGGDYPQGLS